MTTKNKDNNKEMEVEASPRKPSESDMSEPWQQLYRLIQKYVHK